MAAVYNRVVIIFGGSLGINYRTLKREILLSLFTRAYSHE